MVKEWKGRKSDILFVLVFYFVFSISLHINSSFRTASRKGIDVFDEIFSLGSFLLSLFLVLLFFSPVLTFFRKIPKSISIDSSNRIFTIYRHRNHKSIKMHFENVAYSFHQFKFFSVLEIHNRLTATRGHRLEKLSFAFLVPNVGMSWNLKVLKEIVNHLDEQQIANIETKPQKFWKYLYG